MTTIHNLGFPRVGAKRELKFALEAYWQGTSTQDELTEQASQLKQQHWAQQKQLDLVPVGDFSFYDQVLDMSFTLGNIPDRVKKFTGDVLDNYFRVARGRSAIAKGSSSPCCDAVSAGEMTKWFDTNYHYIVPEFTSETSFSLDTSRLLNEVCEAQSQGVKVKPVIIGPITYLALGKAKDASNPLSLLPKLIPVYAELLACLAKHGVEWVQVDEPILATDLAPEWKHAFTEAYEQFKSIPIKVLLATYFGPLLDNRELALSLPVAGLHIDAIMGREEVSLIVDHLSQDKILSLGVVNGRNIWKTDLNATLDWLEPIAHKLGERLWLAPSCSLLHVPVDLASEVKLDHEIKSWLAFALQKLDELHVLATALDQGRDAVRTVLNDNAAALNARRSSSRVHNSSVQERLKHIDVSLGRRQSGYESRAVKQAAHLNLPLYPTTTIGSFPQTAEIRQVRSHYKSGHLDDAAYRHAMQLEIAHGVREQEELGLDVLVHGEAERNDMVEYFGEQLSGYVFSQFGWVQSYGSRCVKPPILFGDVARLKPMTIEWISYAQSLTSKPMKGMLTGPVTILNWSFLRDDQDRSTTCKQIALAIRDEVLDLEKAGIRIIQIDEAALREGLPLRKSDWQEYLDWAIESFRIAANGVKDETQIHTHMCYSEFNDIIASIAEMDADVITIETSRSDMELLDVFERFNYPNAIGPGVYDIHSPNIPNTHEIVSLMLKAGEHIAKERLWVNPDCGLKTRQWAEVIHGLRNMVNAAKYLRERSVH